MYAKPFGKEMKQGDVLKPTLLLKGTLDFPECTPPLKNKKCKMSLDIESPFVAVLSHDCDVSSENIGKRDFIVVSPLHSISAGRKEFLKKSGVDNLTSLNVVKPGVAFVNLFYYGPDPKLNDMECLVDFTNVFSLNAGSVDVESDKVLELDKSTRKSFASKLSLNFHRG
jgi:hypothetical protein